MKNTTTDPTKNTDPNYDESKIFINPRIIKRQGLTEYFETCASCPDPSLPYKANDKENFYLCCSVARPYLIEVEYYDINGVKQVETLTGFIATIFSHEYDHLNGVLHIDYDNEMVSMGFDARQEYRLSHPYKVISEDCPYSEPPKKALKLGGRVKMKKLIVIEVGSTVTKAFLFEQDNTNDLPVELIEFKKHYSDYNKILKADEEKLFNYINGLKEITEDIYVYGTSIFRIISDEEKEAFLSHLKDATGLTMTVASAEQEEMYTIKGVIANIDTTDNIAILVGGGGSNEIAIVKNKKVIENLHIDMGAVDITNKYPDLASDRSTINVNQIIKELEAKITLKNKVDILVLAGSSNKFFRETVGYHFTENVPFNYDKKEMVVMTKEDFDNDDNDYYYHKSLEEMKKYTPNMPNWWVPSRALIAFANAVSNKCGAKYIAASNINMTYGIAEEKKS